MKKIILGSNSPRRKELMKGLPEKYYDVVYYIVIKDYSAKETAEKLNITEANVRKRYERAKTMMKKNMSNVYYI